MLIHTWNVNGIRAALKKGFYEYLINYNPDILCIQETKAHKEQVEMNLSKYGYSYEYWNSAVKKGYSGTAIFSKVKPMDIIYGMGIIKHDQEGRVITIELPDFYLVNVYTPNSKRGLLRLEYREKEWDVDFLKFIDTLNTIKPVIICGDFNVAPEEIDLTNPDSNKNNAGFTKEERRGFFNYKQAGFIDVFRELYPNKIMYTWWSYMANARAKNIGWRIDHFLISKTLLEKVSDIMIHDIVLGSDHCPVGLNLK